MTKTCNKCNTSKQLSEYYTGRSTCKECVKARRKERYASNPSKELEVNKQWYVNNKDKQSKYYRDYTDRNPSSEAYRSGKRRTAKLKATPSWSNLEAIKAIYMLRDTISEVSGVIHHVDHIHPLQSDAVCGLHVLENLQIIPAKENLSKSNKFIGGL